jgi:hypothetical protein
VPTWPVQTVFGLIARPDRDIFLEPVLTRKAAERSSRRCALNQVALRCPALRNLSSGGPRWSVEALDADAQHPPERLGDERRVVPVPCRGAPGVHAGRNAPTFAARVDDPVVDDASSFSERTRGV